MNLFRETAKAGVGTAAAPRGTAGSKHPGTTGSTQPKVAVVGGSQVDAEPLVSAPLALEDQPAAKRESLSTRPLSAKLAAFEAAAKAPTGPATKTSWKQDRPGSWKAKIVVAGGVAQKKRLSQLP